MEIISVVAGVVSVIIGLYAICITRKEAKKSDENYNRTKIILHEIQRRTEGLSNGIHVIEERQITVNNELLRRLGEAKLDLEPMTVEEIRNILYGESTVEVSVPNAAGGETAIIDKVKDINASVARELNR